MKEKNEKTTSRNPLFPEGTFQRGDYVKIAKMAGVSRSSVVQTIVYRNRRNQEVIKAAKVLAKFNRTEIKTN